MEILRMGFVGEQELKIKINGVLLERHTTGNRN